MTIFVKVVPLIFPRKNFSLKRLPGMFSHPLETFFSRSSKKLLFVKIHSVKKFVALNVLLVSMVVSPGFREKEALQRLAE